jgi:hypothetical protein
MIFILIAFQVFAASTPTFAGDEKGTIGKGTIGIVCVDSLGVPHLWNSQRKSDRADDRSDFEVCIDEVVSTWETKPVAPPTRNDLSCEARASQAAADDHALDDLIGGYRTYKKALDLNKSAR